VHAPVEDMINEQGAGYRHEMAAAGAGMHVRALRGLLQRDRTL